MHEIESSRIVAPSGAEGTGSGAPRDSQPSGLAVERPQTAEEALRLAIVLCVEAGDLEGAEVLLEAAKRTKPRPVAQLTLARWRDEGGRKR